MFRGKVQRIHFVGIGGSGMSGIAEVLITQGYSVTGSDMNEGQAVRRLRKLGGTVHIGHDPRHVASRRRESPQVLRGDGQRRIAPTVTA